MGKSGLMKSFVNVLVLWSVALGCLLLTVPASLASVLSPHGDMHHANGTENVVLSEVPIVSQTGKIVQYPLISQLLSGTHCLGSPLAQKFLQERQ